MIAKAFGVAGLGEHDISRGHDSGVLMVKDSGSGFSLRKEHYLSPAGLTTCAAIRFLVLIFSLSLALRHSPLSLPVRASFLLSFRPERSAVEESLAIPDLSKAVRA